jgi:import inner membrane translocase subunit TIM23
VVGTAVFNWRNRKFRAQMDEKEKEFYRRIKRYRVDPSASSMANPVPGMHPSLSIPLEYADEIG